MEHGCRRTTGVLMAGAASQGAAPSPSAPVELTTLTDGGQPATRVAAEIGAFLTAARETLDLALYDVRLETEAGALVLASLLAAHQRGVRVRLIYNVDHPGPIPVPPPDTSTPDGTVTERGIVRVGATLPDAVCGYTVTVCAPAAPDPLFVT